MSTDNDTKLGLAGIIATALVCISVVWGIVYYNVAVTAKYIEGGYRNCPGSSQSWCK